jgi:glycerol-3-phosphate O-acyltransferase
MTNSVRDVLRVDTRGKSTLERLFPDMAEIVNKDFDYQVPGKEIRKEVLQSKRVCNGITRSTELALARGGSVTDPAEVRRGEEARAAHVISTMAAILYKTMLRVAGVVLFPILRRLFKGIQLPSGQIKMVQDAASKGYPVVFLPTHKSHLDYLIMSFVLVNIDVKAPHIAAGDNLNIPIFAWLQRHLGGFFIKRRLDNGNGKDVLYRAVLHEYMEQLLKKGQNIEFFLEGSRSRSGKPVHPKGGLLSVLVETVSDGIVPDIYIVPVDISYDKIFENGLKRELMGQEKKRESFLQACYSVWRMITTNLGVVRLDFSQPFSLREYISSRVIFDLPWEERMLKSYSEEEAKKRKVVSALARHIVHDSQCTASAMATSMVAFLMLTKHRKGVSRSSLITSYNWLAMELKARNRYSFSIYAIILSHTLWVSLVLHLVYFCLQIFPAALFPLVSHIVCIYLCSFPSCFVVIFVFSDPLLRPLAFSGPPAAAVAHAERYLGDMLRRQSPSIGRSSSKEIFYPNFNPPHILGIVHHSNQIISSFLMESIVACSINALLVNQQSEMEENPVISREELLEAAVLLCSVLSKEFIFSKPCVHVEGAVDDGIESLMARGILTSREDHLVSGSSRAGGFSAWDEDEDLHDTSEHWLQVNRSGRYIEYLRFLQNALAPFVESYWLVAHSLLELDGVDIDEKQFVSDVHKKALERVSSGEASYAETASIDPLRNAVQRYKEMQFLVAVDNAATSTHSRVPLKVQSVSQIRELTMDLVEYC